MEEKVENGSGFDIKFSCLYSRWGQWTQHKLRVKHSKFKATNNGSYTEYLS